MSTNAPRTATRLAILIPASIVLALGLLMHPIARELLARYTGGTNHVAEASSGGTLTYHQATFETDGAGSMLITPPGTTITLPGNYTFVSGSTAQLQAIAAQYYQFDHWEGAITGTENPKTVTINSAMTFRSIFKPTISFVSGSYSKNENETSATIYLSRNSGWLGTSTVTINKTGTAQLGSDYTLNPSGTITFPSGSVLQSFVVNITNDIIDEDNETAIFTLTSPTNAIIVSPASHTFTINDEDSLPTVQMQGSNLNPTEGGTQPTLQVYLSPTSGKQVTVPFTLSNSPPTQGSDYTLSPAQVVIAPGQGSAASPISLPISIIDDNVYDGGVESLTVTIGSPTNATVGSPNQRTINIADNDVLLTLNIHGSGTVTRDPAATNNLPNSQFVYTVGTPVTLTAHPAEGYGLYKWEGAIATTPPAVAPLTPPALTMNSNKTVDAYFQQQYTLTTAVDPESSGTGKIFPPSPNGNSTAEGTITPQWANENATVTATPTGNSRFKEWTNALSGNTNPSPIMMNGPKTVKAKFIARHLLTTSVSGTGSISSTFEGAPEEGPGPWYDKGTTVTLTAHLPEPADGWQFKHWKDVNSGLTFQTASVDVEMNSDQNYEAVFEQWLTFTTTAEPSWAGNISVELPEGAGPGPTYQLLANTLVRVRATRIGSRLDRWTVNSLNQGAADYMEFPLQNNNTTVVAYFVPTTTVNVIPETLDAYGQVIPFGMGGCVSPPGGDLDYKTYTFEATAFPDHRFLQWAGDVTGTENPVPLLINGPKTVRAQFIRTFWIDGYNYPANAGNMTCTLLSGHNNAGHYDDGSTVELKATPVEGMAFGHWEIEVPYSGDPPIESFVQSLPITMDTHKKVTAYFVDAHTLTVPVEPEGAGSVFVQPVIDGVAVGQPQELVSGSGEFPVGSTQRLTTQPNEDYLFSYWAGDIEVGTDTDEVSIDITMDSDKQVVAHFVQRPGVGDVNMIVNFPAFLAIVGIEDNIETFDSNEIEYNGGGEGNFIGNGIPDIAELQLLETVLRTPRLDLSAQSGVAGGFIWETWLHNLAQATADITTANLPPEVDAAIVARIVAGYMTLGDFTSQYAIEHMLQSAYPSAHLERSGYRHGGMPYLTYNHDADNDGRTNLDEWNDSDGDDWLDRIKNYIHEAIGAPTSTPASPPPSPQQLGAQQCLDTCQVSAQVGNANAGNSAAWVLSLEEELIRGTDVFIGVNADEEDGWYFDHWMAPTINGSRCKTDRFNLNTDSVATAYFVNPHIEIPDDNSSYTIEVSSSDGAFETRDQNGRRIIVGPASSTVTLEAKSDTRYFYWWNTAGGYPSSLRNFQNPITVPVHTAPNNHYFEPTFTNGPIDDADFYTVNIEKSEGGRVESGAWLEIGMIGYVYLDSIKTPNGRGTWVAPVPAPGYEFDDWEMEILPDFYFPNPSNRALVAINEHANGKAKARFKRKEEYELSLSVNKLDGHPAGSVGTVGNTNKYLPKDSIVTLVATPQQPGYVFDHWEGNAEDIYGQASTASIRVRDYVSIRAVFKHHPDFLQLYQGDRRILESSGDSDGDGIPDNVAVIDASPTPPVLSAQIPGATGPVSWRLQIHYTREVNDGHGHHQPQTEWLYIPPEQGYWTAWDNQPWPIEPGYFGGFALLEASYCGLVYEFGFHIKGQNPGFSAITTNLADDKYRALIWQESVYRQFQAPKKPEGRENGDQVGYPLNNGYDAKKVGDGGYGLGQITSDPPTLDELWNWKSNASRAKVRLDHTRTKAMANINAIISDSNLEHTATPEEILMEQWYLYQQGEGASPGYWDGVETYLDEQNVTRTRLKQTGPSNNGTDHAEHCIQFYTAHPWNVQP